MVPQSRSDFSAFCLRRLGAPMLKINVSEEQVDDCIDQALYYYSEYHMDGTTKQYYSYQLTQNDINTKSITMPAGFTGVLKIFPIGQALNSNSLFNMKYQFIVNDLYSLTQASMIPYYMTMSRIAMLEEMLVGNVPIRYNRHENVLHLDMDTTFLQPGMYVVVESYQKLDPVANPDMWSDLYLQKYTTALIKRQWGENMKKFTMPLPGGGSSLNGQKIWEEAEAEILRLEDQMLKTYSLPSAVMVG